MMKVGLMTFFIGQNYGAMLQAWALWHLLSDLGCEVEFIDYHHPWSKTPNWWNWRSYASRSFSGGFQRIKAMIHHLKLRHQFAKMEVLFPRTEVNYGANPHLLEQYPPSADVYVVGSDQVWRVVPKWFAYIRPYFLPFGASAIKRVAYAASIGGCDLDGEKYPEITKLLKRFDAISVREASSLDGVANLARKEISVMPDPTLALGASGFNALREMSPFVPKVDDVFYLMDGVDPAVHNVLQALAGPHAYNIALQGFRLKGRRDFTPTVPQFVNVISNSRCVITNSFHGCVFSILFHRPFAFIPFSGQESSRNKRIEQLLADFELQSQWADDVSKKTIEKILSNDVDWGSVDRILELMHKRASEWLKEVLAG